MIFRLTQALNARVKAGVLEPSPLHENTLLDWSARLFFVSRRPFILVSNTASLLSAVVPGVGVTTEARFRDQALDAVRGSLSALGYDALSRTLIPADGEPIRYAKTLNRSVTGSMTELVGCAEFFLGEGVLSLAQVGDRLNDTLLSAVAAGSHGYGKPTEAFRRMVAGTMPHVPRRE